MKAPTTEQCPAHSAVILDWAEPFAQRVMARIHEYDDDRPKPFNIDNVVQFKCMTAPPKGRAA